MVSIPFAKKSIKFENRWSTLMSMVRACARAFCRSFFSSAFWITFHNIYFLTFFPHSFCMVSYYFKESTSLLWLSFSSFNSVEFRWEILLLFCKITSEQSMSTSYRTLDLYIYGQSIQIKIINWMWELQKRRELVRTIQWNRARKQCTWVCGGKTAKQQQEKLNEWTNEYGNRISYT